jgi:hypothetical protein
MKCTTRCDLGVHDPRSRGDRGWGMARGNFSTDRRETAPQRPPPLRGGSGRVWGCCRQPRARGGIPSRRGEEQPPPGWRHPPPLRRGKFAARPPRPLPARRNASRAQPSWPSRLNLSPGGIAHPAAGRWRRILPRGPLAPVLKICQSFADRTALLSIRRGRSIAPLRATRPSPGMGCTPIRLARSSRTETERRGAEPERAAIWMQSRCTLG